MAMLTTPTASSKPSAAPDAGTPDHGKRPPAVLLISIAGAMAVLALGAAWLWMTRGAAILLDIGQLFCL